MSEELWTVESGVADGQNQRGLAKVSRDPVSVEVSRKLLSYVLSGEVKVGGRLASERQLAEQLDVGRNAIRDGLRPLILLGILEVRPGSGTYLKAATSDLLPEVIEWGLVLGEPSMIDLVETRLYLESALARLAAERRSASSLDAIEASAKEMESAAQEGRPETFTAADLAFHLAIAEAAQNDVLAGILRSTRTLLQVWIRRVALRTCLPPVYEEHAAITDAIEQRDIESAGAAMERHLKASTARLFDGLELERNLRVEDTQAS